MHDIPKWKKKNYKTPSSALCISLLVSFPKLFGGAVNGSTASLTPSLSVTRSCRGGEWMCGQSSRALLTAAILKGSGKQRKWGEARLFAWKWKEIKIFVFGISYLGIFKFVTIFKHHCTFKSSLVLLSENWEASENSCAGNYVNRVTDMPGIFLWAEEASGRYAKKKKMGQLGMYEKAWRRRGIGESGIHEKR